MPDRWDVYDDKGQRVGEARPVPDGSYPGESAAAPALGWLIFLVALAVIVLPIGLLYLYVRVWRKSRLAGTLVTLCLAVGAVGLWAATRPDENANPPALAAGTVAWSSVSNAWKGWDLGSSGANVSSGQLVLSGGEVQGPKPGNRYYSVQATFVLDVPSSGPPDPSAKITFSNVWNAYLVRPSNTTTGKPADRRYADGSEHRVVIVVVPDPLRQPGGLVGGACIDGTEAEVVWSIPTHEDDHIWINVTGGTVRVRELTITALEARPRTGYVGSVDG